MIQSPPPPSALCPPGDRPGPERRALGPLGGRVGGGPAAGPGGLHLEGPRPAGAAPQARTLRSGIPAPGAGAVPASGLGHGGGAARRVEPHLFWDQSRVWPV